MKANFAALAICFFGLLSSTNAQQKGLLPPKPVAPGAPAAAAGAEKATVKVTVKSVKHQMQMTPEIMATRVTQKKTPTPRHWLEVEVTFVADKAKAEVAKTGPTIDTLEFKYYVMTKHIDPVTKQPVMLTGTVTHVNVPELVETHSVMYVSPGALSKLAAHAEFTDQDVQGVGVEINYEGQLVGGDALPKAVAGKPWWQDRTGADGMLINKNETPFAPLWADYYADIKAK